MPTDDLMAARRALIEVVGRDKHRKFKPHLTLTMRLEEPELDEMLTALQAGQWHIEQFKTAVTPLYLRQLGKKDVAWRPIYEHPLNQLLASEQSWSGTVLTTRRERIFLEVFGSLRVAPFSSFWPQIVL